MTIDWYSFTPWTALSGGVLIGLAAGLLILWTGRVAGISGILGGLLRPAEGDNIWRLAFLGGMIVAPLLWQMFDRLPPIRIEAGYPLIIAAGLLVGYSTRLGSGCTSGHGVCGISRLSPRSLLATGCFMASGFITVFLLRHVIGG
ncbi:YeeE/YedE family protein [Parahaliea maris]|uniref:YeeE/YedE family protein n=1 Tax=Parahaliea maris TaxID=2716870 RepID=A0A5C8ZR71_9GAMM|nr:YeeE/YedE family protein [Parahaliea maris]TXS90229.1 YeeE/YedE family protein [Parahaliea maris]